MGVRSTIATTALGMGRSIGRGLGCELEVTLNDQHIQTAMVRPGERSSRVWDPNVYARGQMYIEGYCNPVKPRAFIDKDPSELDIGDAFVQGEPPTPDAKAVADGGENEWARHAKLMSSKMYKKHMDQHTASELITPDAKWNKIFVAILVLGGVIVAFGVLAVLLATGAI